MVLVVNGLLAKVPFGLASPIRPKVGRGRPVVFGPRVAAGQPVGAA